jgi:hypothetical protein
LRDRGRSTVDRELQWVGFVQLRQSD